MNQAPIHVYSTKDALYLQSLAAYNFYNTYINNKITCTFLPREASKFHLKKIGVQSSYYIYDHFFIIQDSPLVVTKSFSDFSSFFSIEKRTNLSIDTLIYGSGLTGLLAYRSALSLGKKALVIDDSLFGKELLSEGFSTSLTSDTLSGNENMARIIEEDDTPILFPISIDSITEKHSKIELLHENCVITATELIVTEPIEQHSLGFTKEISDCTNIYTDVYNTIESFLDKRVLIIGDYRIEEKKRIISKVAKKIYFASSTTSPFQLIKLFMTMESALEHY